MSSFIDYTLNPVITPDYWTSTPFSGITVDDPPVTTETLTITLTPAWLPWGASSTDFGTLSDAGGIGSFDPSTHTYTVVTAASGDPAGTGATQFLSQLVYTPPTLADGLSDIIDATVSVNGTADPAGPVVLETVTRPSVAGTTASTVVSGNTNYPFNHVQIEDENFNYNAQVSATIILTDGGVATSDDGVLSGNLTPTGAPGTYFIAAESVYQLQSDLASIVFTPTPVGAGVSRPTGVLLSVTDVNTGLSTADNNASVTVISEPGPAPLITNTAAQTIAAGTAVQPFKATVVYDANANPIDSAQLTISGGGTLAGPGLVSTADPTTYTVAATSPAALNAILQGLTFTPPPIGGAASITSSVALTVTDGSEQTTDQGTQITENQSGPATVAPFTVYDLTTGSITPTSGDPYTGPAPNLTSDIIMATTDNIIVISDTNATNMFIQTGSGTDAISMQNSSGNNVLDGGSGSNFLTGGSGNDTFFVNDAGATATIWSTMVGFHAGDAATVWGITPADFNLAWSDDKGAAGATGLTLDATSPGKPDASLTLAGYSQADLTNGRLSITFGTDPRTATPYMYIVGH